MEAQVLQIDSEESILFKLPTEFITLGSKKYGLRRLTIRRAREWREKFATLLQLQAKAQTENGQATQLELTSELLSQLGKIVADYVGEGVTPESIEESATEAELIEAFQAVAQHARVPFDRLGKIS